MAVLQYSPNLQDGVLLAFWTVLKISPLQFPKPFPISNCFRIRLKLMITQDIVYKKILNCYFYFMSSKCYTQSQWLWRDIKFQLVIEVLQQFFAIFFCDTAIFAECFAVLQSSQPPNVLLCMQSIIDTQGLSHVQNAKSN